MLLTWIPALAIIAQILTVNIATTDAVSLFSIILALIEPLNRIGPVGAGLDVTVVGGNAS
jgi:hypothetical protein